MNSQRELKKKYEAQNPSKEFAERIDEIMTKSKKKSTQRGVLASVASAAVIFVVATNTIPAFAETVSKLPGGDAIVRVVTLGRYEYNDGNISQTVVTPKISGLTDKELEAKINADFKKNSEEIIEEFKRSASELKQADPEAHMASEYNYGILFDNDDYLCVDTYWYTAVGSSSTVRKFFNFNKKTGEQITLKSLFKEGADYRKVISDYVLNEMKRRNDEEGHEIYWCAENEFGEGFKAIRPDQGFYLKDNAVVICFDKYEIAVGAVGCPEFEIPTEDLADVLKKA